MKKVAPLRKMHVQIFVFVAVYVKINFTNL